MGDNQYEVPNRHSFRGPLTYIFETSVKEDGWYATSESFKNAEFGPHASYAKLSQEIYKRLPPNIVVIILHPGGEMAPLLAYRFDG